MSGNRDDSVDNLLQKKQSLAHQNPHQCLVGVLASFRMAEIGNPWSKLYSEHSYQKAPCLNDPISRNMNTVGSSHLGLYMYAHTHTHLCVCIFTHMCVDTHANMHMQPPHTTKRKGVEIVMSTFKLHVACLE